MTCRLIGGLTMSETPNLDRFLQTKELWEEYTELSDEITRIERQKDLGYKKLMLASDSAFTLNQPTPISKSKRVNNLALEAALTGLQVRKTELAGVLRNTFHLEV